MDPISAFALAGTIVTFVDFSGKLISGTKDLYQSTSGALSANEELELVTSDIQSVIKRVQINHAVSQIVGHDSSQSAADVLFREDFIQMCDSALDLAGELLRKLKSLEVDPKTKGVRRFRESLSQAASSAWSRKERDDLASRLKKLQELVKFRILSHLSISLDNLGSTVVDRFKDLDQQTHLIIAALAQLDRKVAIGEAQELTATLASLLARIEISNSKEHRKTRDMISNTIQEELYKKEELLNRQEKGHRIVRRREVVITPIVDVLEVPIYEESKIRLSVSNKVLSQLDFETRTHRLEHIGDAYEETYNWVFDETNGDHQPWYNFSEWLRRDHGVYWIQGKAGAGKSTLMSYIYQDCRTRQYLKEWSSNVIPLYVGSFFFWLSGTREQKSLQGLLRSILFEVLNEEPQLVAIVLPRIWAQQYALAVADKPATDSILWTPKTLKEAFRILIHQTMIPMKLCIFIDGLDEFDGEHCDHEQISELLKNITNANIKICVSSRPWVVFTECFRGLPSLRLQDLTKPDIEAYVYQTLSENNFFRALASGHEAETTIFKRDIVAMAEGIFLWVILVVRSLLDGIRNRDTIPDLQLRLLRCPKDLKLLYTHLLDMVEPEYLLWAAKAFQIVRTAQRHSEVHLIHDPSGSALESILTLLDFHLSINEEIDSLILGTWTDEQAIHECDDTKTRITARCVGLLETTDCGASRSGPWSQVQFLHRTARDYIFTPSVWLRLTSATKATSFDPNVSLLRAYAIQSNLHSKLSDINFEHCIMMALTFGRAADTALNPVPVTILELQHAAILRRMQQDRSWLRTVTVGLPPFNNILPVAAMFGYTNFLQSQSIKVRSRLTTDGASLLHYATPRYQTGFLVVPCALTIKLLLTTCDLNLSYQGITPWRQVLATTKSLLEGGDTLLLRTEHVKILKYMLQAGADPRITVRVTGDHKYNVVEIVRMLRKTTEASEDGNHELLEQIGELEIALDKALTSSRSRAIKTWFLRG